MIKDQLLTLFLALILYLFSGSLTAKGIPDGTGTPAAAKGDSAAVRLSPLRSDEAGSSLFREKLDSMANSWYIRQLFLSGENRLDLYQQRNVSVSDSLIMERLQKTETAVKLPYNSIVRDYIETILNRRPVLTEIILGLSAFYFPMIEEIFDRNELPLELKYLAIIESALNPRAKSRAGAVGLWQFMYGTAKGQNLEVSTLVDERRDVLKSTQAAANYLKQLYDVYKDWHLVIAAYNCGPGNVNKAIDRAGGKTDYWKIYFALPRETREFVPAYIATTYIMNFYREHQLNPILPAIALHTDTLMINKYLNLKQLSELLNIDLEALRALNPTYRRDIIPGTSVKSYPLRIPVELMSDFIHKEDTLFSLARQHKLDNSVARPVTEAEYYDIGNIEGKTKISYTVKSGDNPGYIADWFDISVAELRLWNRIHRNMIRAGQKLVIFVPADKTEYYKKIDNLSFSAKQELPGPKAGIASAANRVTQTAAVSQPTLPDDQYVYYTVETGDNFWTIAKKFTGVTNMDIMQINNISDARSLKVGQKLKIKPKS